jgi:hypothetical protein
MSIQVLVLVLSIEASSRFDDVSLPSPRSNARQAALLCETAQHGVA